MAHVWTPEHPVDAALARALVRSQFPALDAEPAYVGAGWDCDVWRFGEVGFRFPRRNVAVGLLEAEVRVLPGLAPRLPLPIPVPTWLGRPCEPFPYPFYGFPFIAGTPADEAGLDDAARARLAPTLGAFLQALHAIDPQDVQAPPDTFKWDLKAKGQRALERLPLLPEGLPGLAAYLKAPPASQDGTTLLHGDFYVRHLVLARSGLAGIIDWGDVRYGDPALDLAVAYAFLPAEARPAFWAAYGPVDESTRARARYVAVANYGVSLWAYALDVGHEALAAESRASLLRAF